MKNCQNKACKFCTENGCFALTGPAVGKSHTTCSFYKTESQLKEQQTKVCDRLYKMSFSASGRLKLKKILHSYPNLQKQMKINGYPKFIENFKKVYLTNS